MAYIRPKRVDTGKLDGLLYKAEMLHDDLHEAYTDGKVFSCAGKTIDFGKLKAADPKNARHVFNVLHGLVGKVFDVSVLESTKVAEADRVGLKAQYEQLTADNSKTLLQAEKAAIALLKIAGFELVI